MVALISTERRVRGQLLAQVSSKMLSEINISKLSAHIFASSHYDAAWNQIKCNLNLRNSTVCGHSALQNSCFAHHYGGKERDKATYDHIWPFVCGSQIECVKKVVRSVGLCLVISAATSAASAKRVSKSNPTASLTCV
jgi:hypothetical protein